jgi:hypothetical protein
LFTAIFVDRPLLSRSLVLEKKLSQLAEHVETLYKREGWKRSATLREPLYIAVTDITTRLYVSNGLDPVS